MSGDETMPRSGDAIAAEAALWLVRTTDNRATGRRDLGFERWLAEHPRHRAAFAEAKALWRDLGAPAERPRPELAAGPPRRWALPSPRYGWAAALAACLLLIVGLNSWFTASAPRYATAIGEQRSIRLADATKVMLNTDTLIEVEYDGASRRVVLDHGEALFEVAHNPARPFYVQVGDDYVRAVGTSFIVRRNGPGFEVTLLDGRVIVGHSGATGEPSIALRPGERVRFGSGAAPAIDRPVIDDVTAWRRGQLVFDATPIATAIAEMNRYSDRKIALRGNAAAGAKLSGVFEAGDSEGFAGTLAAIYGLRTVKTADALTLENRRAEPAR